MIPRRQWMIVLTGLVFLTGSVLGGGPTSPIVSMLTELPASVLGMLALAGMYNGRSVQEARFALIFLSCLFLLPLLQLIPIPVGYWKNLPGHSVPEAISRLAGLGDMSRPISLDTTRTKLATLSLIVPCAVFLATLQLGSKDRDRVILLIVVFAMVSAILGVFQLATGGLDLAIYPQVHEGYPIGFFANRNHEGSLLLIALPLTAHVVRAQPWTGRVRNYAYAATAVFLTLAVVATQSRAAFAILPVALGGSLYLHLNERKRGAKWTAAAVVAALMTAGSLVVIFTPAGDRLIHRFSDVGDDLRPAIWQGTLVATNKFWPLGSGVGSFVPVYKMSEDLNSVTSAYVNHAHNDYLEIILETGAFGFILLVSYLILFVLAIHFPLSRELAMQRRAAIVVILILALHSCVDYPLRTFCLVTIFAFSNGLLYPSRDPKRRRHHMAKRSRQTTKYPDDRGSSRCKIPTND